LSSGAGSRVGASGSPNSLASARDKVLKASHKVNEKEKPGAPTPGDKSSPASPIIAPWGKCASWWAIALKNEPAPFTALSVAISIAAHAGADGAAWPSIATIGVEIGVRPNAVSKAVQTLIRVGIISRKRRRISNLYQVFLDSPTMRESQDSPTKGESNGSRFTPNGSQIHPKTPADSLPRGEQTDEQTKRNRNDDNGFEKEEDVIANLCRRGIAKAVADASFLRNPSVATSWADCEWSDLPSSVKNHEAYVTSSLKNDRPAPLPKRRLHYGRSDVDEILGPFCVKCETRHLPGTSHTLGDT